MNPSENNAAKLSLMRLFETQELFFPPMSRNSDSMNYYERKNVPLSMISESDDEISSTESELELRNTMTNVSLSTISESDDEISSTESELELRNSMRKSIEQSSVNMVGRRVDQNGNSFWEVRKPIRVTAVIANEPIRNGRGSEKLLNSDKFPEKILPRRNTRPRGSPETGNDVNWETRERNFNAVPSPYANTSMQLTELTIDHSGSDSNDVAEEFRVMDWAYYMLSFFDIGAIWRRTN